MVDIITSSKRKGQFNCHGDAIMSAKYEEALELLKQFSKDELISLFNFAFENTKDTFNAVTISSCPHCGGTALIRYGTKCGKPRFKCKSCERTFVTTTNTVMCMSHYDESIWHAVMRDTLEGHSMSFTEKHLGLSHQAVFHMRHKILIAMQDVMAEEPTRLNEVCELDETYVLESYKGTKFAPGFGREPRKHGAVAQKRGISDEYICLCTGVQRGQEAYVHSVNRARPSKQELISVFSEHVGEGALYLTDGLRGYDVLETLTDCSVKSVETEKSSFYHLNTVNNLHSFIKDRYKFYRGVATKYINRYGVLFSVAYRKTQDVIDHLESLIFSVSTRSYTHGIYDVKQHQLLLI